MREILFRGKRVNNGDWVVGALVDYSPVLAYIKAPLKNKFGITFLEYFEVHPLTVGQYTGLNDNDGNRIFEGDVLFIPRLGKGYAVKYDLGQFFIGINQPVAYERHSAKIIGNVHDNPELLNG